MTAKLERRSEIPRRCAWCERFCVHGTWIEGRRDADAVNAHGGRATHTICEDCAERLRARGKSH